jgi:hypothetical protein
MKFATIIVNTSTCKGIEPLKLALPITSDLQLTKLTYNYNFKKQNAKRETIVIGV